MRGLETLTTTELSAWVQQARTFARKGKVIDRIPQLALADANLFAVCVLCAKGSVYSEGETSCIFPLMSAVKPFSLLYLLQHLGTETVFQWVGVEPSDVAFNSLEQLVKDRGRPRNPMINSGAITLADKLPGKSASDRSQHLCQWLNQRAGCQLELDEVMLASVRLVNSQVNRDIARYLAQAGYLEDIEKAIDTYEQICCLSGTVEDLARLGLLLACENGRVATQYRRYVNALMLTCGLYEASPQYALQIGLPIKSGVGGALLAVVPGRGAIACYSPALDNAGNPVAALAFVEAISQDLGLSIFGN
ncbi:MULTISPECIES: glutaminase A [Nostocales]|uniref:Glutaminase n=3 Tax=Nostocales TaxID=1161 RepID=A0A0C1QVD1_9CYAN|nr:glutaminase A [Tolypothrix bouteillei]KAF3888756.1 glutaminase A [Tolypothrix bouteillei VB521301]